MSDTELILHQGREISREVTAADFKPIFSVEEAIERKKQIGQIIGSVLNDGTDYGKMPGGRDTKVLMKSGAEKLASMFGLAPRYIAEVEIEDWTGKDHGEPLFYYKYRCQLFRGDRLLGEAIGSCSSWESKYRYRWVKREDIPSSAPDWDTLPTRSGSIIEFTFAVDKSETSGKYGKPAAYWEKWKAAIADGSARKIRKADSKGVERDAWEMGDSLYRVSNPEIADIVNTVQKMAQKRAFVAVVLVATNASDSFTQDLEDFSDIDTGSHPTGTQEAADHVANGKIEELSSATRSAPPTTRPAEGGNGTGIPVPSTSEQHEPPELIAHYKKLAISMDEREWTLGDLMAQLRITLGNPQADAHWKAALAKHGDPMTDLGRARNVARYLFNQNKVQEKLPL